MQLKFVFPSSKINFAIAIRKDASMNIYLHEKKDLISET